jgi:hypothetical protein
MKPDPNKLFHFAPLLPNGSQERQLMLINEVDLLKLPGGRSSRRVTVHDVRSGKAYIVRGIYIRAATYPEDHRLIEGD